MSTPFDKKAFNDFIKEANGLVNVEANAILVGSAAIMFLADHYNIVCTIKPNDGDFVRVSYAPLSRQYGEYLSEQKDTNSKTFANPLGGWSFDLSNVTNFKFVNIGGVNVAHPDLLLKLYDANLREKDGEKLIILRKIIDVFNAQSGEVKVYTETARKFRYLARTDSEEIVATQSMKRQQSVQCGQQIVFSDNEEVRTPPRKVRKTD